MNEEQKGIWKEAVMACF